MRKLINFSDMFSVSGSLAMRFPDLVLSFLVLAKNLNIVGHYLISYVPEILLS